MFLRNEIRNRLKNSGVGDVQSARNQVMKDKVIETLPQRALTFVIDLFPYLFMEKKRTKETQLNQMQGREL